MMDRYEGHEGMNAGRLQSMDPESEDAVEALKGAEGEAKIEAMETAILVLAEQRRQMYRPAANDTAHGAAYAAPHDRRWPRARRGGELPGDG